MRYFYYLTRLILLAETPKQKISVIVWSKQHYLLFHLA